MNKITFFENFLKNNLHDKIQLYKFATVNLNNKKIDLI